MKQQHRPQAAHLRLHSPQVWEGQVALPRVSYLGPNMESRWPRGAGSFPRGSQMTSEECDASQTLGLERAHCHSCPYSICQSQCHGQTQLTGVEDVVPWKSWWQHYRLSHDLIYCVAHNPQAGRGRAEVGLAVGPRVEAFPLASVRCGGGDAHRGLTHLRVQQPRLCGHTQTRRHTRPHCGH
uniref:Uncharacterized protein n=1 Tax=Myotis myotis TaxID=51298 RepID=A0A7J7RN66_MYOMY|nr:hypothetical protein mMyoMyo1_010243 [Myotis myotis]